MPIWKHLTRFCLGKNCQKEDLIAKIQSGTDKTVRSDNIDSVCC